LWHLGEFPQWNLGDFTWHLWKGLQRHLTAIVSERLTCKAEYKGWDSDWKHVSSDWFKKMETVHKQILAILNAQQTQTS